MIGRCGAQEVVVQLVAVDAPAPPELDAGHASGGMCRGKEATDVRLFEVERLRDVAHTHHLPVVAEQRVGPFPCS